MQICLNCGYINDDALYLCRHCNALLQPPTPAPARDGAPSTATSPTAAPTPPVTPARSTPAAPTPLPRLASRQQRQMRKAVWFIIGAVLGLIPAAIYAGGAAAYGLHGFYSNSFGSVAGPGWPTFGCYLIPVVFIVMGIFVSMRRFRPFSYGLLAAAIISPVVVGISCVAATKVWCKGLRVVDMRERKNICACAQTAATEMSRKRKPADAVATCSLSR